MDSIFVARMFAPLSGVPEDPANGEAQLRCLGLLAHYGAINRRAYGSASRKGGDGLGPAFCFSGRRRLRESSSQRGSEGRVSQSAMA